MSAATADLPRATGLRGHRDEPLLRALAALRPDPGRLLLAVLAGSAALGCAVGLMATSAWLISRAAQQPPVLVLQVAVVATRAFGTGRGVLRYVERLVSHDVALRGVVELRERLYRRLAGGDPATVAGLGRGDLLARVGADVDTLADLVVRALLPFAVAVVTALGSSLLVAAVLGSAGLVVAAGLAAAGLLAPWLALRAAHRAETAAARARTRTAVEVQLLCDGLAELTVAGAVPDRLERIAATDAELAVELDAAARPAAWSAAVQVLATGAAMLGALALGLAAVDAGTLDPVLLAVVALTPLAAAETVAGLPAAATSLIRCREAAVRVLALLDTPQRPDPATDDPATAPLPAAPLPAAPLPAAPLPAASLQARGLDCGWGAASAPVVRGLDLDLSPGRRVAVVGPSGTGKTTLLLTLAGLLPPVAGRLTLAAGGGAPRPLVELPPALVRATVSYTAEDAHLFTTTVRENLRVGRPGASDARLQQVLAAVGLADWVQDLPRGLDTPLGSGGTGCSGGQRRRLLLARALLVGAGVLLLDEPGEHLDPGPADDLVRRLLTGELAAAAADPAAADPAGPGPAVLLVTHRLAPLAAADEVIVLDGGRLAARGSHSWLLEHHDAYRRNWRAERGAPDPSHEAPPAPASAPTEGPSDE